MRINYQFTSITPPPLDTKLVVKRSKFVFSDGAEIINMDSKIWSEESAVESLIGNGFDLWAEV